MGRSSLAFLSLITACGCGSGGGGRDGGTTLGDAAGTGFDAKVAGDEAAGKPDSANSQDAGCASFASCGGSLVGTWKVESGCIQVATPTSTASPCQPFTTVSGPTFTGSYEFASGDTYAATMALTSTSKGTYSPDCLAQMRMSCADFNTVSSQPDAKVAFTCVSSSSGNCDCSAALHTTNTEQGTYTTSGNTFTTTPQGSANPTTGEYCVQGNTLRLRFVDSSSSGSATFTIVATMQ